MHGWAIQRQQKGRGIIGDQRKANVGRMQEAEKEERGGRKEGKSTGNLPEFSALSVNTGHEKQGSVNVTYFKFTLPRVVNFHIDT